MKLSSERINIFKNFIMLIVALLVISSVTVVNANIICNDGTVSGSCNDCHQGCCSRHGGCSSGYSGYSSTKKSKSSKKSSSTKKSYSTNKSYSTTKSSKSRLISDSISQVVTIKKSDNNKIKSIMIDNKSVSVTNVIKYTTIKDKAEIKVVLESKKATVKYNKTINLNHGSNTQKIVVTAENGDQRTYSVIITKLNTNTNIKSIKVNNEEVSLVLMKYSSTEKEVDIEVIPEDEFATAKYTKHLTLDDSKVELPIAIVAENGNVKEYSLAIEYDESVDTIAGYIADGIMLAGAGAAGGGIYYGVRKKRSKKISDYVKCPNCNRVLSKGDSFCEHCGNKL